MVESPSGRGDRERDTGWAPALGWGALALLGWALTRVVASRRYRYAKLGVLVCGALACLVPLWFAFANVVDVLPANL